MPPNTSQIRLIANQSFGCYPHFSKTVSSHLKVPSLDVPPEIVQSRLARETRVSAMNPCESWNIPLGYAH